MREILSKRGEREKWISRKGSPDDILSDVNHLDISTALVGLLHLRLTVFHDSRHAAGPCMDGMLIVFLLYTQVREVIKRLDVLVIFWHLSVEPDNTVFVEIGSLELRLST